MRDFWAWLSGLKIQYKLIPFLLLYITISVVFAPQRYCGDEERYLWFANNLLHGYYSPAFPEINLWNGPGYPILIAPFMFIKCPLLVFRILNAVFLYISLLINYKAFRFYISDKMAFIYTVFLGMYFPVYQMLPLILTESFTWFILSVIFYLFIRNFKQNHISWKLRVYVSLSIAYLVMTKVIFGYVIILMFGISLILLVVPKFKNSAKKSALIFFLSFLFCLPYLIYTYSLTNKLLFFSNSGSMSLYTMSSPVESELGDWQENSKLEQTPFHKKIMDSISKLKPIEIDEAFKEAAKQNIKSYPQKYFTNWLANVGRLFFSYPFSNKSQTINTFYTFLPNIAFFSLFFVSLFLNIIYWKVIPQEIIFLHLFVLGYLFASTLVSTYNRMFFITIPYWFIYSSYIFNNLISIKINIEDKSQPY